MASDEGIRLNKFLASCGVGSRRACDEMVLQGQVELNGRPCLNPAERILPKDFVKVGGKRVQAKRTTTIIFNKPRGLVCSKDDELGRDTIYAALPVTLAHLNHVGRLDRDSEGLLVLTNDGALAHALLHPSKEIEKEYLVTANQPVTDEHLDLFLSGVYVAEGKVKLRAREIERLSPRRLRIVLTTGYKRQIREMLKALGYGVQRLVRIRIGAFSIGTMEPGAWAQLDAVEIDALGRNPKARQRPKAKREAPLRRSGTESARGPAKKKARPAKGRPDRDERTPPRPAKKAGRRPKF
ncbi:MAG: pseudouridine synthase [Akkermansiaceae bacterium]|jgi:23S rRNA pseudouridine2605 synthase|nr:pseudouridine synthase [Akkermansiaceae bacterium]